MKPSRTQVVLTLQVFVLSLVPPSEGVAKRPVPGAARKAVETGTLRIVCPVEGARFLVDEGRETSVEGVTPSRDVVLPVGSHTIRVSKDGYLPFSEVFDISAGDVTELEVDLVLYSGRLRVEAGPPPVQVQVDDRDAGAAPIEVDLAIGEHVVRMTKPGYVEEVRRPLIKTGQTTRVEVTLVPVEVAVRKATGGPIYTKWWFWGVIAAVAAGAIIPTVILTRPKTHKADTPYKIELP